MIKSQNSKYKNSLIYFCAVILMTMVPIGMIMVNDLDCDTWFMLNHGRYILANGLYPEFEPFTVHSNLHFTFQKWLACILFWVIYKYCGAIGLKAFISIIYCAFSLVLFKLLNYITTGKSRIFNAFIVSISNILMLDFYYTRPQVFTYLFLAIEILCLEKYIKEKKLKYLAVIPVLSLLEIQLHSTIWPILLIFLLPYMFDVSNLKIMRKQSLIVKRDYSRAAIWIVFVISIAVALINPYGFESIVYLIKSLNIPELKMTIPEVRPPELLSLTTLSVIVFSVLFIIKVIKNRSVELRFVFLFAGTMLMALMSKRQLSFLIIAGAILTASGAPLKIDIKKMLIFIVSLGLLSASILYLNYSNPNSHLRDIVDVVDYLDSVEDGEDIKVFSLSDPGSYLEFKGFRTYSDTRAEVFSDKINLEKNVLAEKIDYILRKKSYKELFKEYDFDYALIYNDDLQYDDISGDKGIEAMYKNEYFTLFKINDI